MPWRPLPQIAFAVCIYPFQPSQAADLPLDIGDELYIIEQGGANGDWYRGYLVAPPSLLAGLNSVKGQTLEARVFSGIFPKVCVEIREVLSDERRRTQQSSAGLSRAGTNASSQFNGAHTPARSESPPPPLPNATGIIDAANAPRKSVGAKSIGGKSTGGLTIDSTEPNSTTKRRFGRVENMKLSGLATRTPSTHSQPAVAPQSPASATSPGADNDAPAKPMAPVPMLKIGDETPTSADEPLVDEIASCLREWHSTKVHEMLLARHYSSLDRMSHLVTKLDISRRQLLHKVLTEYELRNLRERTVWDLVKGNRMLSGEVIVRSPSQRGRILTSEDSPVELSRLQSEMSLLTERPVPLVDEHILHHLFVSVQDSFGEVAASTTMAVHLCLKTPGEPSRPISEVFAMDIAGDKFSPSYDPNLKTLFSDLSGTDIGEGAGVGSELYLVFKVLANEPFREGLLRPTSSLESAADYAASMSGANPGMNGRGGRTNSALGKSGVGNANSTAAARGQGIDPTTGAPIFRAPGNKEQKFIKRTVAAGILRVDDAIRKNEEVEASVTFVTPGYNPEARSDLDPSFNDLMNDVLPSSSGYYRPYTFEHPVTVSMKSFTHDDVDALIQMTPTLLLNVSPTRKIGFSGAPTKPRSDIYLTLSEANVSKQLQLAHPKFGTASMAQATSLANLQLTLEVRRSTGERIENCIYPSGNSAGHTAWRTTACERGEPWNLTIRLAIAPEDVPGCHIIMSIADAPGFPFCLSWMPLWIDGAFVRDGEHRLCLYSYDEYTSSMISGRGAYLALPWSTPKQSDAIQTMASLQVKTFLCSTKYSQDPTVLGLLRWSDSSPDALKNLLKRFVFVPEIEIVKLLNEVFDALFDILVDYAGSQEHEDLVFGALVFILGIVHDRRFRLGPLVDQYAETETKHRETAVGLLRAFNRLLGSPGDPESARKLRATFKVGAQIFKFISAARRVNSEPAGSNLKGDREFRMDLKNFFKSLESLMINPAPLLIGTKTLIVQYFHTWVPELSLVMDNQDALQMVTDFLDSCADVQGKLILYKLVLIYHLADLDLYKMPQNRQSLLVNTPRWLAPYWGLTDAATEQWKDQVRLCCSVVATQVSDLGQEACDYIPKLVDSYRVIQALPRHPKKTLSLLFPSSYPFPSRPILAEADFDECLIEIAAVLAATTNLPTLIHLDLGESDLAEFLFSALQVYISILDGEAFPRSWLSLHIYHHRSAMRTLEKLSSNLTDLFLPHPDDADQFNTELWRAFFDALLKLVGSDALALETFPEQKRRAVWKIAGDVREQGADLLRRSWDAIGWETSAEDRKQYGLEKLGGYQVQYVPGLVAPIVELCLSVHEGLRSVATSVLQTMIVSEWTLTQDLSLIQAEMIDCLDRLFKTRHLTESIVQKLFISELLSLFEPLAKAEEKGEVRAEKDIADKEEEQTLYGAVKALADTIDELLDLLAAVHGVDSIGEAFKIMDTLHLMEFLKDMHREDIYICYVHQLATLQTDAKNHTEAGLALRLHAELYNWDPNGLLEPLDDPVFPTQTAFERKEQLYFQMIKHYEEGQSWDNALGCYIELSTQYEQNIFDFSKLARAQRAMATIYETIGKGEQHSPRYFRVIYKGLGFPAALRDKQFIFQGSSHDRLESFKDKLQQQHPAAQILGGGAEEDVEGQYLEVYSVTPKKDLLHPVYQRAKVNQSVRDYHLLARPNVFTSHTRRQKSEAGVKEQLVEKTVYTTAETFPTILRRSEIVDVSTVKLTPVQAAIERTTRKTAELAAFEKRILEGDDSAFTPLTEALLTAVDSASESSVSHYRELLPKRNDESDAEDSEDDEAEPEEERPLDPLENALRVALIDHTIVIKRCLGHYSRAHQKATQAELMQQLELTYAPELDLLAPLTAPDEPNTTSWIVDNSFPAMSPGGGLQSSNNNGIHHYGHMDREGGGINRSPDRQDALDRSGSKQGGEKNRLSLAFLKRGSFFKSNDGGDGGFRADSPEIRSPSAATYGNRYASDAPVIALGPRAASRQTNDSSRQFSFERGRDFGGRDGGSTMQSPQPSALRPQHQQQYGLTMAGGNGGGDRLSNVKKFGKRLSSFNLGRKGSRANVQDGGRVQPVLEE